MKILEDNILLNIDVKEKHYLEEKAFQANAYGKILETNSAFSFAVIESAQKSGLSVSAVASFFNWELAGPFYRMSYCKLNLEQDGRRIVYAAAIPKRVFYSLKRREYFDISLIFEPFDGTKKYVHTEDKPTLRKWLKGLFQSS